MFALYRFQNHSVQIKCNIICCSTFSVFWKKIIVKIRLKFFFITNWPLMVSKKSFDSVCVRPCTWHVYVPSSVNCTFGITSTRSKFCVYALEGKFPFPDFDHRYLNGVLEFIQFKKFIQLKSKMVARSWLKFVSNC